jgi:hypothetical protein
MRSFARSLLRTRSHSRSEDLVFQGTCSTMSRRRALSRRCKLGVKLLYVSYLMLHDVIYLFHRMLKSSDSREKMLQLGR